MVHVKTEMSEQTQKVAGRKVLIRLRAKTCIFSFTKNAKGQKQLYYVQRFSVIETRENNRLRKSLPAQMDQLLLDTRTLAAA